jgi:LysR family transcriptional regulator, glycine cleavage system transcriptional activator
MTKPCFNPLDQLTAIRAFEAASRLGSFREAAAELCVTDGAVSRLIRQLEQASGVQLFERRHRRIEPTTAGHAFAREVQPAFERMRRAGEYLAAESERMPLAIAAPATTLLRWLIPRQRRLESATLGTPVRLVTWDGPPDVDDRSISMFLGIGEKPVGRAAVTVDLMAESFALVVSPGHLRDGIPVQEVLKGLPRLVSKTRPNIWRDWVEEGGFDAPFSEVREFERMYFALQAAEAGVGSAIAPVEIIAEVLADGRLVAPFGRVVRRGTYHLVIPSRASRRPAVRRAVRWFTAECRASA